MKADRPVSRRKVIKATYGLAIASLAWPGAAFGAGTGGPVVATRHGRIRGKVEDDVFVFRGVRYGADTAAYRFQPPRLPEAWTGTRDAIDYGAASPQRQIEEETSEDCLFLNIWTRGLRDEAKRPVMVYFHGGAHSSGSGSDPLYDGKALCRRGDVVVVTVNHRLNVFGYGYFARSGVPELADSGNVGNLDLIQALKWVRDNIMEFGGDPANVMMFGQSGGGAKVVTLMAMPGADGLYHRAATMSGQHVTVMGPSHAAQRADAFLEQLGIKRDRIDLLRSMPPQMLVDALGMTDPVLGKGRIIFWSVLDMRSTIAHPFHPTAPRRSAHIPLMFGNTHDETRAFLGGDPLNFSLSWEELPDRLDAEMVSDIDRDYVIARYREHFPDYSPSEVFFAATTSGRSRRGHLIQAERRAELDTPSWMYQLDFPSPADGGRLRAFHTLDIPLVFDNVAQPGSQTGDTHEAHALAARMSASFIALARHGDPQTPGLPEWPRYSLPRRATMIFDTDCRVEDDPRAFERQLFDTVPYVKPGT